MEHYLMGINLGVAKVTVLIQDLMGIQIACVSKQYGIIIPWEGCAEQDMDQLWASTAQAIGEALREGGARPEDISAVGVSGQMHGMVALDKAGNPVHNAIISFDRRSRDAISEIYLSISKGEFSEKTYNQLETGCLIASLVWLRRHRPEAYERIRVVMLPKDYIRYRLCGEVGTDCTDAAGSMVFNVAKRHWETDFMEKLGIDPQIFPPVGESCEIAGYVTPQAAAETGLQIGTPLSFGGGDQPMQLLGSGIVKPGKILANIATAVQMAAVVPKPIQDANLRALVYPFADSHTWAIMCAGLNGMVSLKWFKDIVGLASYDDVLRAAVLSPPGCNGVVSVPYLCGVYTPYKNPLAKAIFFGLTINSTQADLARSMLEGIVFGQRDSLNVLHSMQIPTEMILSSGGGDISPLWRQIQADILGREIYRSFPREKACLGAAITAGVAVGLYASLEEGCARSIRLRDDVTVPNPNLKAMYDEKYETFRELYRRNRDLF
ncbi:xylulokinase [Ruminococcaceae bacterium OttesenSCG-928-L11]|nr:xylulokinase [Ruminococcaceae bacterium OttesenSCG-928-L11]